MEFDVTSASIEKGSIQKTRQTVVVAFLGKTRKQERKRVGGDSSSLKLNLTDPCHTVPCQYHSWGMPGWQAGSPIAVYARIQCRGPKQGRKRFNYIVKTIHFSYLPIIYLCRSLSILTSVILRELVFPTWYSPSYKCVYSICNVLYCKLQYVLYL